MPRSPRMCSGFRLYPEVAHVPAQIIAPISKVSHFTQTGRSSWRLDHVPCRKTQFEYHSKGGWRGLEQRSAGRFVQVRRALPHTAFTIKLSSALEMAGKTAGLLRNQHGMAGASVRLSPTVDDVMI
jgi:hypothetical protein